MIAIWMLAAVLFSACVAAAAFAVERLWRAHHRESRGVWLTAMAIAVLWPILVLTVHIESPARVDVATMTDGAFVASSAEVEDAFVSRADTRIGWLTANSSLINAIVLTLWAACSGALLLRLLRAVMKVRSLTRTAHAHRVDGTTLLVADDIGPASVGWMRPQVVVPSWVLSLDAPLRSLVLQHEQEHCRAHDPRLVWCAAIACIVVPWNACVWWIARRLRLAIELDCDARTLRHGGDRLRYAKLLLFMTQHPAHNASLPLATSMAASRSHLGLRIEAVRRGTTVRSRTARIALTSMALVAVVAACGTEIPSNVVARDEASPVGPLDTSRAASSTPQPLWYGVSYPPMMRVARIEGTVVVAFAVDPDGRVDMNSLKVISSDHAQFTAAVRRALVTATFEPARTNGKPVRHAFEQPFVFALGMDSVSSKLARFHNQNAHAVVIPEREQIPGVGEALLEHQVLSPVRLMGPLDMRYPPSLRDGAVEGDVTAQFVVNTDGSVETATINVIHSDHELFADAVRGALRTARYAPAQAGGTAVRQLTQQYFSFQLDR